MQYKLTLITKLIQILRYDIFPQNRRYTYLNYNLTNYSLINLRSDIIMVQFFFLVTK